MTYTIHNAGGFTEIIKDAALEKALREAKGKTVTFRVFEDEWSADYTVRTIRRAEIRERP